MKKIIGYLVLITVAPFIHGVVTLASNEGFKEAVYWFFYTYALEAFLAFMIFIVYISLKLIGVKFD